MSDIHKGPGESVDLSLLLESYGEDLGLLFPLAFVYDPFNNSIENSPFALQFVDNNLYVLNNAFQASSMGTYKVIYIVYTDAGFVTRSSQQSERHDTITVSLQSTTGLGGGNFGGTDNFYDDTFLRNYIAKSLLPINKQLEKINKELSSGLKISSAINIEGLPEIKKIDDILNKIANQPKNDFNILPEIKALEKLNINSLKKSEELQQSLKSKTKDLLDAIKKNRSVIIKSKFDKSLLSPMLEQILIQNEKTGSFLSSMKIDITKSIELENDKNIVKIEESLDKNNIIILEMMNKLNESIRIKLKYSLDYVLSGLRSFSNAKNNVNVILKKEDL